MEFSLDQFYRINRRILIWVALFLLIWLLRDFFGLVFLVFVLTFIAAPCSGFLRRYLHLPYRTSIVVVYLCFLLAFASFIRFVAPQVTREAQTVVRNIGQLESKLIAQKNQLAERYPSLDPILTDYIRDNLPEEERKEIETNADLDDGTPTGPASERLIHAFVNFQLRRVTSSIPHFIATLSTGLLTMALALLFSFLISLDIGRLRREVESLKDSRLHDFFEQTAQPVVRFGYVVGRGLQAQAMIACLNTLLTLIGLLIIGVPDMAVLSLIVFLCSFVPVLGVFISTTPIILVAINNGGVSQALGVVGLVTIIHLIEAYVLNPLIYGKHLKLNPVVVLMILFVGHHAFGLWGMLLGVPVAHYFMHDVLGVRSDGGILSTDSDKSKEPPPEAAS
jgi:predicted PurR-regulated permease PerM